MSEIDFQTDFTSDNKPSIGDVVTRMAQEDKHDSSIVSGTVSQGLSDLSKEDLKTLNELWNQISPSYKHKVLQALVHASENNFEYDYKEVGLMGLSDDSPMVRSAAIDLLWEDESVDIMRTLIRLINHDDSSHVKAQALIGLSRFILLGEYGEISAELANEAQQLALKLHTDLSQPMEVRRRALEALSNSSHQDKDKLIRSAYQSDDHLLKVSSIFAMGRTCDDKWQDFLLDELDSDDHELVYEAVRACGEIQLESSVRQLKELLLSEDREIQTMSIWALGEIGGKDAVDTLSSLQEAIEDEELLEIIEEAIDVASFSFMGSSFDFDFDE